MKKIIFLVLLIGLASGGYYLYGDKLFTEKQVLSYQTLEEEDPYVRFGMEAYDLILKNYWEEPKNYTLPTIFKLSLEKATNGSHNLSSTTREATASMLALALQNATSSDAKKEMLINTLIVATYNLQPVGRNGILSTAQETEFRQNVANINPEKNLYQNIGLEKGASISEVSEAYKKKEAELKASTTPEAKELLKQAVYANKVLTNPNNKKLYDENQMEPTVWATKFDKTLYLYIDKVSPATFLEFAQAIESATSTTGFDSLVLDLRGNVGGSLDFVQNFLGLFIGPNQYAFDLFTQGKYEAQRTVQPKFTVLDKFTEVGIITDNMSQSTAEVVSATFKRLRLGKTVGTNTRGWGTVENTYPIQTEIDPKMKYTLLLVNSITLRDDNQPIEGRGVDPDVNTTDATWKAKLKTQFRSSSLIKTLETTAGKPPVK